MEGRSTASITRKRHTKNPDTSGHTEDPYDDEIEAVGSGLQHSAFVIVEPSAESRKQRAESIVPLKG